LLSLRAILTLYLLAMKHLFCCFFILFLSMSFTSPPLHYIQCILVGVKTEDECRLIEQIIKAHNGFESVRADIYSDNLLAFYYSSYNFNENDLNQWLQPLGVEIKCFKKGVVGPQPIVKLDKNNCEILERK
jgi:hypothetical protein